MHCFAQSPRRKYFQSASVEIAIALILAMVGARLADAAEGVTIEIRTTCEAMAPTSCQGAYGFKIRPDGSFVSGPSPNGRTFSGRLPPSDSGSIEELAQQVLKEFEDPGATCAARVSAIPGVSEALEVSGSGKTITMHGAAGVMDSRCAATGARDAAALFKRAHDLMSRHYPHPFP
jgi:hypothetical protein